MNRLKKEDINYHVFRLLDILVLAGLSTVVLMNIPRRYIPKILNPFFFYEQFASVYFFSLFCFVFFLLLLKEKEYKKVLFLIVSGLVFAFIQTIVMIHGFLLLSNISISDISALEGTRATLYNLVLNKTHLSQTKSLFCSEVIYSICSSLLEYKDTFFVSFCLYFFYRQRVDVLKKIINISMYLSFGFICLYEVIEIPYLLNQEWAKQILIRINPYLSEICYAHGWYPPLLWLGQLRGLFSEPSFFGYYLAFALCFFLYKFTCKPNFTNAVIAFVSMVLSVLTDSRIAIALMFGVVLMYLIYNFFFRRNIKYIYIIVLFIVVLYVPTVVDTINTKSIGNTVSTLTEKDNLKSVETFASIVDPTARSNASRYSHLKAQIKIWKNHPIFGVGPDYIGPHMSDEMKQSKNISSEMKNWFNFQDDMGQLESTYPCLCQYSYWLSTGGIVLFILHMFVICYVCIRYLTLICKRGISIINDFSFFVLSCLAVVFVYGIGGSFLYYYYYVVLLGIALSDIYFLTYHSKIEKISK